MNYALDALWWRLQDPHVRDLASLLTAPPLWHSGSELPLRELLGDTGFRFLLALDSAPQALHTYLEDKYPFGHRLGVYAEHLLAFWLAHAPHAQLLAHNLPVRDESNSQTLGALDFIAALNGQIYHIELTCKYYGDAAGNTAQMCGLNHNDRLLDKVAKLTQQLAWAADPAGIRALQARGLAASIRSVSVVRGMGFTVAATTCAAPLNRYAWFGRYMEQGLENRFSGSLPPCLYRLPHMSWLAPARVEEHCLTGVETMIDNAGALFAVMEKRPDGYWHEIERIMQAGAT